MRPKDHQHLLERELRGRRQKMTTTEKDSYITSIEESASIISSQVGSAVVDSVFQRYGAHSVDDLSLCDLPDVFSELYAIEADLR